MRIDPDRRDDAFLGVAIARASRLEAIPVPIVTIRDTPTARARSTRNAAGSSHPSRCACVSITGARLLHGRIEPREQRGRRRDALVSPVSP